MRRLIAVFAVLFLAVSSLPVHAAEEGKAEAKKDDKSKAPAHKLTQAESFLQLDSIYATFLENDRPIGKLGLDVGIDIPDPKLRAEAEHALPVIRDAFVRNLIRYGATAVRSYRQPDINDLVGRLQAVLDRSLGRKGGKVLIMNIRIGLN